MMLEDYSSLLIVKVMANPTEITDSQKTILLANDPS
jgi:hypothetical protein